MPPYLREIPASFAATVNVGQDNVTGAAGVTPGSIFELPAGNVTESRKRSLPVHNRRMAAPAALNVLCPEMNSANGGVGKVEGWYGIHSDPSIVTVPSPGPPQLRIVLPCNRYGIAETGRTESNARFASQAAIPASKIALVRAKNNFASSSSVW